MTETVATIPTIDVEQAIHLARGTFDIEIHPGRAQGRRLLTQVRDVMRSGNAVPRTAPHAGLGGALSSSDLMRARVI